MHRRNLTFTLRRLFTLEDDMKRINRFHSQLKAVYEANNPINDYQKCLKKINFTIFRQMIDHYEDTIKPIIDNETRITQLNALQSQHNFQIETGPNNGYLSFIRESLGYQFELRVLRFIDRRKPANKEEEEIRKTEEEILLRKQLKAERESIDERYYFKQNGRCIPTQLLGLQKYMLESSLDPKKVLKNPFQFHDTDTDILEIQVRIAKSKKSSDLLIFDGFISDL